MPNYEEIKVELVEIAKILDKYPDDLKSKVFDLLISQYLGIKSMSEIPKNKLPESTITDKSSSEVKQRKKQGKESFSIERNLNLRGGDNIPSFMKFVEEKQPDSVADFNTVSVYYLKKILNMETVTLNHAFTCYKEVNRRPPEYFRQGFRDTKNKQGYIDLTEDGNLTITYRGEVFVEHDLPKKGEDNSK